MSPSTKRLASLVLIALLALGVLIMAHAVMRETLPGAPVVQATPVPVVPTITSPTPIPQPQPVTPVVTATERPIMDLPKGMPKTGSGGLER